VKRALVWSESHGDFSARIFNQVGELRKIVDSFGGRYFAIARDVKVIRQEEYAFFSVYDSWGCTAAKRWILMENMSVNPTV
jgi:hypothetical protein